MKYFDLAPYKIMQGDLEEDFIGKILFNLDGFIDHVIYSYGYLVRSCTYTSPYNEAFTEGNSSKQAVSI